MARWLNVVLVLAVLVALVLSGLAFSRSRHRRTRSITGPTGVGVAGPQGVAGVSGLSIVGPTGPQGISGVSIVGPTGPQGISGVSIVGPTGPQGISGLSIVGATGPTGVGATGPQGISGLSTVGPTGEVGVTGPTGVGATGPQGEQGATGFGSNTTLIAFSTGVILAGATVTSAAPVLMAFGSNTVEVVDGAGESVLPPQAGGFAFPIPQNGTVHDLQVSCDLLVSSVVSINTLGLQYDFTVFLAPSAPNSGIDHPASPFLTTPLGSSVQFGFPSNVLAPGDFRACTNINPGSLPVIVGDRIGVRVRTLFLTDPSAADVTQLSFSASLSFTPS